MREATAKINAREAARAKLIAALDDYILTVQGAVAEALPPPEPKPEPAPPAPPAYEDVRRVALRFMQAKGKPALAEVLKRFGAAKAPDLKPEQFADFIEALK